MRTYQNEDIRQVPLSKRFVDKRGCAYTHMEWMLNAANAAYDISHTLWVFTVRACYARNIAICSN